MSEVCDFVFDSFLVSGPSGRKGAGEFSYRPLPEALRSGVRASLRGLRRWDLALKGLEALRPGMRSAGSRGLRP